MIELDHVGFAYPAQGATVHDVSFRIEKGEFAAILGANGAGKTTTLKLIDGLIKPTAGKVLIGGKDTRETRVSHRARQVGFLFQNPDVMLFNASVREEIAFGPRQLGLPEAETEARVRDCMALFGLEPLADKAPYQLSGGQKKQLALAAVLALNPEVLLLDEPLAGLDRGTREKLLALLTELLAAGTTLILATHDDALCAALGARSLELTGD